MVRLLISLLLLAHSGFCQFGIRARHPRAGLTATEDWSSGNAPCGAFTGSTCLHTWIAGTGGMPSLAAASTAMPGLSWNLTGTNVLAVSTTSGTNSYIKMPIPAYIPQLGATSATVDVTFSVKVSSAGALNFSTSGLVGIGYTTSALIGEVRLYGITSGSQIKLAYTAGSGPLTITANTSYIVTLHLAVGTNASSLRVVTASTGVDIASSPEVFTTSGANLTTYANALFVGTYAGVTAAETYWIGNIRVDASAASGQKNPPDMMMDGAGTTSAGTVAVGDFATAAHGYCNGNGSTSAASGWTGSTLSNLTWDNTYAISPVSPVTVGGTQRTGATPLSIKAPYCGMAGGGCSGGTPKCLFTTTQTAAVAMFYFLSSVDTGVSAGGGAGAVTRLFGGGDFVAVNANYSTVGDGKLTTESYNSGVTTQANAISFVKYHWYALVLAYQLQKPHTTAVYDIGPAWIASTAYGAGATVVDTHAPPHLQQCTVAGTSGSSKPTWNVGTTTSDGGATWTDTGLIAPVLIGISVGQSTSTNPLTNLPNEWDLSDVGAGGGAGFLWETNAVLDYSQARLTTLTNVSSALCANAYPGCLRATDLVIDGSDSTVVSSVTHAFVSGDVNRTLTVTAGSGCTAAAYNINSVSAGKATLSSSAGTLGATGCSWDLATVTIGVLRP